MKRGPAIAMLVVIAAAFAWWLGSRQDGAALPPSALAPDQATEDANGADPERAEVAKVDEPAAPATADDEPLQREQVETAPAAPVLAAGEAVMRGRCVDQEGNPIAGVQVELHGWVANDSRLEAYRRDHGDVVWEDPEDFATGADGRFLVRFVPPPPYQFVLDLESPGLIPVGGRWSKLEAGTDKDLGDIALIAGVEVTGRVVDVDGVPQQGVRLSLDRYNRRDRPTTEIKPEESARVTTGTDGTFRMRKPLAPGTWNLDLRDSRLVEPRAEVVIEMPTTQLELVVKRATDVQQIRGIVVAEDGKPVRGAQVEPARRGGGGWMTSSGADGTFTLLRRPEGDPDGPFPLQVERAGYEPLTTDQEYEWGSDHVRLTLRAGIDLSVHVSKADDGSPVEEFALRVMPKPGSLGRWSTSNTRIQGGWEHEGGDAKVVGVRRGPHLVLVEPRAASDLMPSQPIEVEVRDGAAAHVDVRLESILRQTIRVVRIDGSAVAGSQVELLATMPGVTVTNETRAMTFHDWGWMQNDSATLIDQATTDNAGICSVGGAPGSAYWLRVTGADHSPLIRADVTLGDQTIDCVVPTGAAVRVTLRPPELIEDLREQAMLPRTGDVPKRQQAKLPGIRLRRQVGERFEMFPPQGQPLAQFDDQGVAVLGGIEAGNWDLQLESVAAFDESGYTHIQDTLRSGLLLRDGQEAAVDLVLPKMRMGRLAGVMTVDGAPHTGGLQLRGEVGLQPNGDVKMAFRSTTCDADGKFETLLPPGTWHVAPYVRIGERGLSVWSPTTSQVVPGQPTQARFDVRIARARLRFLTPDGKPAIGMNVTFERDQTWLEASGDPTDSDGRTTITASAGTATPKVWIRSLQDGEKLSAWWQANRQDPTAMQRAQVSLLPIVFSAGEPQEIEIRLPAEWDR